MKQEVPEEPLVYDIRSEATSSENTETATERPHSLNPVNLAEEVETRVIKVRSQSSSHDSPPCHKVDTPENIIFYEEEPDLASTTLSL